ncbi:MAG TPA: tetratricopeptide repeat protein, partial [Longimicrobiales bacterium]|nr:tetratricopeptide repeat protein [Longimicrobiales bacterium]
LDALVNLGRLVHEGGDVERAVSLYTRALERSDADDPIAAFNLGIALEDLGRYADARDAYHRAVEADPGFADAHYNMSRMCERVGDRVSALRYLKNYKALTSSSR